MSVCPQGEGGGCPIQPEGCTLIRPDAGVPISSSMGSPSNLMGVGDALSGWMGYPLLGWLGVLPRLDGGTAHPLGWMGVPPHQAGWGYPSGRQSSTVSTCCAAGGMPLALSLYCYFKDGKVLTQFLFNLQVRMNGEENDQLTPLSTDNSIMQQILLAKTGEPSKFASFWEMDENDVEVMLFF